MQPNIQKTTLYFDRDFYLEVKKRALEERKTVTELIKETMSASLAVKANRTKKQTRGYVSRGFKFGKSFDQKWTREEIYGFI